jgi:F0F1-type ATP synthase delta subunit
MKQEIVPAEKIEQLLRNKSLSSEKKAKLVEFILNEDGFLSDDFLTTEF